MKLSSVLKNVDHVPYGSLDVNVRGITYSSKKVRKGFVFAALSGFHTDGKKYIPEALANGASVIVSDSRVETRHAPCIVVTDPLSSLAAMSLNFYKHPDSRLQMIGITGTNGKTTITYFLESIFSKTGAKPGVVGTINYRYGGKVIQSTNTTPLSSDLNKILHDMVADKVDTAILEVSSHALALGRVEGIEFDTAVFTNLTRDHLDFHKSMEEYFAEKAKLFVSGLSRKSKKNPKYAIINADDPWGKKLIEMIPEHVTILTYGLGRNASVRAEKISLAHHGNEFILRSPAGSCDAVVPSIGKHNIYNALAAVSAALCSGISVEAAVYGLENSAPAPGRLQKVAEGQPFLVVVDYAHTDDALTNVLTTLKQLKPARLITVFGCGGDRDRSKRPIMGEIATKLSDFVFITSDNPRSEDPQRIALDIEVGVRRQNRTNYQVVLDRESAISGAINMAQKGDIVLLAGKGHETYQILGDKVIHFNDAEVAREHLKNRFK